MPLIPVRYPMIACCKKVQKKCLPPCRSCLLSLRKADVVSILAIGLRVIIIFVNMGIFRTHLEPT